MAKTLIREKKKFDFIKSAGEITFVASKVKEAKGILKMVQIAWGVKASIIVTESGEVFVNAYVFDADRYNEEKASDWLSENQMNLEKSFATIQESMPAGSFEDITARIYDAVMQAKYFPIPEEGEAFDPSQPMPLCCVYIVCVFPDRVIVQCDDESFQISYTDKNGIITLGEPVKVTPDFVAAEAKKCKMQMPLNESIEKLKIIEATAHPADGKARELIAVLIEEGASITKNRFYPASALKEAAPLFAGLKNYIDHPTSQEEREKPERSIKDWVSTIKESWYEDGKIMGKIVIHDDWLWEKIQDPVFRENIGLSINANGKRSIKEVEGKPMEVIEKIFAPKSVDWVTEPGARGRVAHLLESAKKQTEGDIQMLKTVKLDEVKAERPDLISVIESEARVKFEAEHKEKTEVAVKEAVAPLQKQIDDMKAEKIKIAEANKISELIGASKLPKKAQEKLIAELSSTVFGDETKLTEAVTAKIKSELSYLQEAAGIKVGVGASEKSSALSPLEKRLGLKETAEK